MSAVYVVIYGAQEGGSVLSVHETEAGAIAYVESEAVRRRTFTREYHILRRDRDGRLTWQIIAPTRGDRRWRPYYIRSTYYEVERKEVRP